MAVLALIIELSPLLECEREVIPLDPGWGTSDTATRHALCYVPAPRPPGLGGVWMKGRFTSSEAVNRFSQVIGFVAPVGIATTVTVDCRVGYADTNIPQHALHAAQHAHALQL